MIAFVEGPVVAIRESSAVIAVAGVGIEVFAPRPTLDGLQPNAVARLETYLLVREDALALYGFADADSLELFRLLLGVSGVGPRLALALLSNLSPAGLAGAVANGDVAMLASTPGVGKRTAERLALDLANKIPARLAQSTSKISEQGPFRDALDALVGLGFRESQARTALLSLLEAEPGINAETLIRKGLSKLR